MGEKRHEGTLFLFLFYCFIVEYKWYNGLCKKSDEKQEKHILVAMQVCKK